jgi:hypothetical protein
VAIDVDDDSEIIVVIGYTDIYPDIEQFGGLQDGQQFRERVQG